MVQSLAWLHILSAIPYSVASWHLLVIQITMTLERNVKGAYVMTSQIWRHLLNKKSVRDALGVRNIDFVSCSPTVYQAMLVDWMRNLKVGIPALLEDGIKLLVYAGEYDLICNWLGNSRWVHAMEWFGQKEFVASSEVPFVVDGSEAGVLKTHGSLGFLKVSSLYQPYLYLCFDNLTGSRCGSHGSYGPAEGSIGDAEKVD
ncbi:hypothetical protein CRYUN_Cryun09bG0082000 [Craigia yunnanensis]